MGQGGAIVEGAPATTVEIMANDESAPKGKNKRCSDQLSVGGVRSAPGEVLWCLRDGNVTKVRGRGQLSVEPERIVVTRGNTPPATSFDPRWVAPAGTWAGFTSRGLARASADKRRGGAIRAAATAAASPAVAGRVVLRDRIRLGCSPQETVVLADLAGSVRDAGGRAVVVGGAVRDMVAGRLRGVNMAVKDLDVEVYGVEGDRLRNLLAGSGRRVDEVGASFGVLKVLDRGVDLDVSMPRRESSTGAGHRDFAVAADPHMSFTEAALRRDFTIGAMGFDPLTGELLDPYGGAADLTAGVLRHVSDAFAEDPLRVLRGARFAARFGLTMHPDTVALCRSLRPAAAGLAAERIWGELELTIRQATRPGEALRVLDQVDWIDIHPEIADLRGVAQDPEWHPEGDVFVHTAHVLDYWSTHLRTGVADDDMVVALACLCHDLGKPAVTVSAEGRWRAHGHEAAGVAPTATWLARWEAQRYGRQVEALVGAHMRPIALHDLQRKGNLPNPAAAVRRLANTVGRIDLLVAVCEADQGGRPPRGGEVGAAAAAWILGIARTLGVESSRPVPLVGGDDLIALGARPGPGFGPVLATLYEAQLDGAFTSAAEAAPMLARLAAESGLDAPSKPRRA